MVEPESDINNNTINITEQQLISCNTICTQVNPEDFMLTQKDTDIHVLMFEVCGKPRDIASL